jgi:BON domain
VKRERLSSSEALGWSMVGFGAGIVGGLWAAGWLGRVTRGRLADEVRAVRTPAGKSAVALAETVRQALQADPALAPLELRAVAVTRGAVELVGWVPDRRTRAHAVRVASGVSGVADLINSLLVQGEDNIGVPPELSLEGRSA